MLEVDVRETKRPSCAQIMRLLSVNLSNPVPVLLANSVLEKANVTCSNIQCKRLHSKQQQKKPKQQNHYNTLGVPAKATTAQIKHAYYRLSKIYHPDRNKSPAASVKFQELTDAYETLSNPRLRSQYDGVLFKPMTQSGVVIPEIVLKESWRRASHPTGRAKVAYDMDEWMKRHYYQTFVREQRIKGDVKLDRSPTNQYDEAVWHAWWVKPTAWFLLVLIAFNTYLNHRDKKIVDKRIGEGYYEDFLTRKNNGFGKSAP